MSRERARCSATRRRRGYSNKNHSGFWGCHPRPVLHRAKESESENVRSHDPNIQPQAMPPMTAAKVADKAYVVSPTRKRESALVQAISSSCVEKPVRPSTVAVSHGFRESGDTFWRRGAEYRAPYGQIRPVRSRRSRWSGCHLLVPVASVHDDWLAGDREGAGGDPNKSGSRNSHRGIRTKPAATAPTVAPAV